MLSVGGLSVGRVDGKLTIGRAGVGSEGTQLVSPMKGAVWFWAWFGVVCFGLAWFFTMMRIEVVSCGKSCRGGTEASVKITCGGEGNTSR